LVAQIGIIAAETHRHSTIILDGRHAQGKAIFCSVPILPCHTQ